MQTGTQRVVIHTGMQPSPEKIIYESEKKTKNKRGTAKKRRVNASERLLRNTAIACTLLLGVLTLRNVDSPWTQAAVSGIESALTMRIDPDETLGRLSFVKSIVPESTLVFLNISGNDPLEPVTGNTVHEYSEGQPWTVYSCGESKQVRSVMAGTVSAVVCMDSGDWCVMVDHGGGVETMYAYMEKPEVDAGDQVSRGQQLGNVRGDELYYEYRLNGESVAPGTDEGE